MVSLINVKNMERMFGELFLLNIVKKKKKTSKELVEPKWNPFC